MKQVLIQKGRAVVQEMPAPRCGDGEVLVRAAYSLISTGTETTTLKGSAELPAGRWARRLGKVGEVVRTVAERGPRTALASVRDRLGGPCFVTGYSLSGTVLEVGSGVSDLVPGQRVACAGASSAHHAEIVAVPRKLTVPVPDNLPSDQAAFVTLGAIALQGVRQADLRLGEIAYVTGLGLVGQLTVALLRASGCRVWGSDLSSRRVESARGMGLEMGLVAGRDDPERRIDHATGGRGVDAVLLTASTESSEPVRQALRLVRSRGRIVVVGSVGLDLEREAFYAKEAELRISRSYGPGRYDPSYEEEGRDYPYAFVRWTENRNMEEFLRLAGDGEVPLKGLTGEVFPVEEARKAYELLSRPDDPPPAVLLRYDGAGEESSAAAQERKVELLPGGSSRRLGVALVGPGAFAAEVHLPNLASLAPAASLRTVVGRTANPARELARRWSAAYATTDLDEALADPEVDLVLVCTRHDLHAEQAARSLEAGKAVFLEKPAAIDGEGLERLERAVEGSTRPFVVGFNRRLAPDTVELKKLVEGRRGPLVLEYRVNAGKLPADHWALGPQGGGRLIGEACHMVDLLGHLVGAPRVGHRLMPLPPPPGRADLPLGDNFVLTCRHADGSLTNLFYTSLGHAGAGKERLEAHWDGQTALIDDFRGLALHGASASRPGPERESPDKGHRELLRRFVEHVAGREAEPIPWSEILETTRFMLELARQVRRADPEG